MSDTDQPMQATEAPEVAETAAEAPAEQPEQPAAAEQANEQPAVEPVAEAEAAAEKADEKAEEKIEDKPMEKSPERVVKERERSRERSRSRDRDRRRDGERDKDFRARSRSRSRDRRRRSRSRSRDRRRSRSRSRSPYDKSRSSHRSRRSRFEDDNDSDKEERRKRTAAAAAAAAPPSGAFPGPPGAADPLAALRAANPALAALDPATAQLVMRQQMMLQQQLLMAQQQAAVLQAQQVMSKAKSGAGNAQQEKQLKAQRELFVGNLAPGVGEQSLYQVFHSALIAAFPQAGQPGQEPVLKVALNGRFAFVEFRVPEYATAALQLNGQIALMGNTLKIARPASYVEMPMMGGGLAGLSGMPVQVIADLHQESSKYGAVLSVKVPRPPPGQAAQLMGTQHFGKAFVQFADVPSAQKAKDAIHGRMFAGNIVQALHISLPSFQSIPASVTI